MKKPYVVKVTQTFNVEVSATNAINAKKQVVNLFQSGDITYDDTTKSHMTAVRRPKEKAVSATVSGKIKDILASEGLIDLNRYWSFNNDKCKTERKLKWYYTGLIDKLVDHDADDVKAKQVTARIEKKMKAAGIAYNKAGFRQCWGYTAFVVRVPFE